MLLRNRSTITTLSLSNSEIGTLFRYDVMNECLLTSSLQEMTNYHKNKNKNKPTTYYPNDKNKLTIVILIRIIRSITLSYSNLII